MRAFDPLAAIGAMTDEPHEEEAECFGSSVRVAANGMKAFLALGPKPLSYYFIPEAERSARCKLTTNTCIVDGEHFFVRGSLEIPVHDAEEPFIWGVWVSLSPRNFEQFVGLLDREDRSKYLPYFVGCRPTSRDIRMQRTSRRRSIGATMGYGQSLRLSRLIIR